MLYSKVIPTCGRQELSWFALQKKKQLDELAAELRVMKLSPEQKEKLIKILRK